jgi:thymidylate synthase ThyX
MAFADAKHRPHGVHTGEIPKFDIDIGPAALSVELDTWGPRENLFPAMYDALQSNWGDAPSRTVHSEVIHDMEGNAVGTSWNPNGPRIDAWLLPDWAIETGWWRLNRDQRAYVVSCFGGKTLQQILEMLTFTFVVDGVTRAFTHEYVRARIGSGFMQHGGRDNDWRHRNWTLPETIRRAAIAIGENPGDLGKQQHCLVNQKPLEELFSNYMDEGPGQDTDPLIAILQDHLRRGKELYAALVDAGIPWQDARRVLPIGTQTYIHGTFNYVAMKGVLAHRLEHIMDWEINCVSQLMLREIRKYCPPLLSHFLGSHSDMAGRAMFEGLESWPPDGKYPATTIRCKNCGHAEANHLQHPDSDDVKLCEVCERQGGTEWPAGIGVKTQPIHPFMAEDTLQRQHRREQNPFWVLHPDSMAGGPVQWLWTNGNYQDIQEQLHGQGKEETKPAGHHSAKRSSVEEAGR